MKKFGAERHGEAIGRFIVRFVVWLSMFVVGVVGMWWIMQLGQSTINATDPRYFELPIAIPEDISPEDCVLDLACAQAVFLQMAVSGSTAEPLPQWGVSKWEKDEVVVAVYGKESISSGDIDMAEFVIDSTLDTHNKFGARARLAERGEEGDINVFFTKDSIGDYERFQKESGLATFSQIYDPADGDNANCWEKSITFQAGIKGRFVSAVIVEIQSSDVADVLLMRCIMEELTHGLSPIRRDLADMAETFFLDTGVEKSEWLVTFSPLDKLMFAIGHNELIVDGDNLEQVVDKFPAIYSDAIQKIE